MLYIRLEFVTYTSLRSRLPVVERKPGKPERWWSLTWWFPSTYVFEVLQTAAWRTVWVAVVYRSRERLWVKQGTPRGSQQPWNLAVVQPFRNLSWNLCWNLEISEIWNQPCISLYISAFAFITWAVYAYARACARSHSETLHVFFVYTNLLHIYADDTQSSWYNS